MKIIRKDFLKAILAIALLIAVVLISGCSKKEKTVGGALIGAAAGAGIGAAAGDAGGAIAGGAIGGLAGGIIDHELGDDDED